MNTRFFRQVSAILGATPAIKDVFKALRSQKSLEIEGPEGSGMALLLAMLLEAGADCSAKADFSANADEAPRAALVVVPTEREAAELAGDLETFLGSDSDTQVTILPWWGTMPYREIPPLSAVFGERTKALAALCGGMGGCALDAKAGVGNTAGTKAVVGDAAGRQIVIAPERAFLTPLPPADYFRRLLLPIKAGDKIDTREIADTLVRYGYNRVPRVQLRGEFALRGEVLDVFMGGDDEAYRILFDFDTVETIKRFDPEADAQPTTREKLNGMVLRPLKETIWDEQTITALREVLAALPECAASAATADAVAGGVSDAASGGVGAKKAALSEGSERFLDELEIYGASAGEELFFPLAFKGAANAKKVPGTILDYLPEGSPVFFFDRERLENAQEALESEYQGMFRKTLRESAWPRPLPAPERILLNFKELAAQSVYSVSFMGIRDAAAKRLHIPCDPARSFFGNINYLKEEFTSLLNQHWKIVVAAESEAQAARIGELLRDVAGESAAAAAGKGKGAAKRPTGGEELPSLSVLAAPLSSGFSMIEAKLMVVGENEIFGRRKRPPRSLAKVKSSPIDTFVELNPGDYIVHVNYGIGLFKGIERVRALGNERDYVKLEYLDDETVFVPIEQVNLIQRYIGNEGAPPRLDKIGSKSWENRKGRVKASVEDIAEKLITLYSKRKASRGFAFPKDTEWQTIFEAAFPWEETEDQLRCVEEIKADMESSSPMDRLVCGDVGYGKTEVALRACFKAVMGGKQVAFLAPTTILAEQHYETFTDRFKQFPVKVAMLSRFVPPAETKRTIEALKKGEADILVGTHRIIQKDIEFKNLGLLVIDEEQRFGVRDKEKLKAIKTNVDCLTLSATPIPRTLHMSLLKIRDMSLLATPPRNRHPIETVIAEFDEDRLAQAIRGEVERGGQVFFLHNRVETLRETRIMLERIVPEMLIETAHGQMDSKDLEDVMHRFIHGGFHVLVSTTIIENGIDIPNVNTIIIDRADMYGVSQLYQLRGRVGRSDRVAYAFLLYPSDRALSELAMKRLQVISDFTELGSGFKIAMKDMEIRGAGNLLGREQSGDIYSVGFDLYLRLLDEAVQRLENENYQPEEETLLELEYTGFIPDSYIADAQEKMEVYKKIASVRAREELETLHAQLVDRFGPPPDEAASLLSLAEIRIICRDIAVSSLKEKQGLVMVEFGKVSKVKVDSLVRLLKEGAGRVKLDPHRPNVLVLKTGNIGLKEKSEFIREKLAALA